MICKASLFSLAAVAMLAPQVMAICSPGDIAIGEVASNITNPVSTVPYIVESGVQTVQSLIAETLGRPTPLRYGIQTAMFSMKNQVTPTRAESTRMVQLSSASLDRAYILISSTNSTDQSNTFVRIQWSTCLRSAWGWP